LADKYGRRLACLVFCGTYAASCLTKISNDVIVLFIGRLLGGLSTTLMYSVFESWMVTEYYAQHLEKSSMSLSAMFGIMTTLNSIVAIISGVLGESLVSATGTKVSPFMAAIVCLGLAFWLMTQNWVCPQLSLIALNVFFEEIANIGRLRTMAIVRTSRNSKYQKSPL
jgi:MFS transporter, MFS domain-containing protein family, molybdate-anion transporter